MNEQDYLDLTTYRAGGFALVEKCSEGLRVDWDNGLHVILTRAQTVGLARLLTEFVDWEAWS
jgi:hypothetical protein